MIGRVFPIGTRGLNGVFNLRFILQAEGNVWVRDGNMTYLSVVVSEHQPTPPVIESSVGFISNPNGKLLSLKMASRMPLR